MRGATVCDSAPGILGNNGTCIGRFCGRISTARASACWNSDVSNSHTLVKGAPMSERVFVALLQSSDLHDTRRLLHAATGHTAWRRIDDGMPVRAGGAGPCTHALFPRAGGLVKGGGDDDTGARGLASPCNSPPPWVLPRLDAADSEGARWSGGTALPLEAKGPAATPCPASPAEHKRQRAAYPGEYMPLLRPLVSL